jgi:cell division protein FtsN
VRRALLSLGGCGVGSGIGWFDKVVTVVVLGAAFIFELTSANSQPIEIGDSGEILPGKPQEEKQPLAEGGSGNQVHPVDATDS